MVKKKIKDCLKTPYCILKYLIETMYINPCNDCKRMELDKVIYIKGKIHGKKESRRTTNR
jgi:hypothetical protein